MRSPDLPYVEIRLDRGPDWPDQRDVSEHLPPCTGASLLSFEARRSQTEAVNPRHPAFPFRSRADGVARPGDGRPRSAAQLKRPKSCPRTAPFGNAAVWTFA
jgi:hypothetical protein